MILMIHVDLIGVYVTSTKVINYCWNDIVVLVLTICPLLMFQKQCCEIIHYYISICNVKSFGIYFQNDELKK